MHAVIVDAHTAVDHSSCTESAVCCDFFFSLLNFLAFSEGRGVLRLLNGTLC